MTGHTVLYDIEERTGTPEYASVDRVCERVLDRAVDPQTDHPDADLWRDHRAKTYYQDGLASAARAEAMYELATETHA